MVSDVGEHYDTATPVEPADTLGDTIRLSGELVGEVRKLASMTGQTAELELVFLVRAGLRQMATHHLDGTANERHA